MVVEASDDGTCRPGGGYTAGVCGCGLLVYSMGVAELRQAPGIGGGDGGFTEECGAGYVCIVALRLSCD
jgi:hypothetical protein